MADWPSVVLGIGSAASGGIIAYFIARQQSQSAERRLKLQLDEAREHEERQRKREIRSTPLLAFRAELATLVEKCSALLLSAELGQRMFDVGESDPGVAADLGNESGYLNSSYLEYIRSRSFERAKFQLSDATIVEKATSIFNGYHDLYKKIAPVHSGRNSSLSNEDSEGHRLETEVAQLQELINQRLEAL